MPPIDQQHNRLQVLPLYANAPVLQGPTLEQILPHLYRRIML